MTSSLTCKSSLIALHYKLNFLLTHCHIMFKHQFMLRSGKLPQSCIGSGGIHGRCQSFLRRIHEAKKEKMWKRKWIYIFKQFAKQKNVHPATCPPHPLVVKLISKTHFRLAKLGSQLNWKSFSYLFMTFLLRVRSGPFNSPLSLAEGGFKLVSWRIQK